MASLPLSCLMLTCHLDCIVSSCPCCAPLTTLLSLPCFTQSDVKAVSGDVRRLPTVTPRAVSLKLQVDLQRAVAKVCVSLPFSSLLFLPLFVSVYNLAEIVLVYCLCLSTCAFASLSICYFSICLCLYLYVCLIVYPFVCVSACMFLCLSVCPPVCEHLPICQSITMCVCVSVYLSLSELSIRSQPATAF